MPAQIRVTSYKYFLGFYIFFLLCLFFKESSDKKKLFCHSEMSLWSLTVHVVKQLHYDSLVMPRCVMLGIKCLFRLAGTEGLFWNYSRNQGAWYWAFDEVGMDVKENSRKTLHHCVTKCGKKSEVSIYPLNLKFWKIILSGIAYLIVKFWTIHHQYLNISSFWDSYFKV